MRRTVPILFLSILLMTTPAQAVMPDEPPGDSNDDVLPEVWSESEVNAKCLLEYNSELDETSFETLSLGVGWGLLTASIGTWKSKSLKVQWSVDCEIGADVSFGGSGGAYREVMVTTTLAASQPPASYDEEKSKHGTCSYSVYPNSCEGAYTLDAASVRVESGHGKNVPSQVELCISGSAKVEGGSTFELALDPFATDTDRALDGADGCAMFAVDDPDDDIEQVMRTNSLANLEEQWF